MIGVGGFERFRFINRLADTMSWLLETMAVRMIADLVATLPSLSSGQTVIALVSLAVLAFGGWNSGT